MSKRRRDFWDGDAIEFQGNQTPQVNHPILSHTVEEPQEVQDDTLYLEEAHEALSKLFNRTNKRARQMRGVRRRDAWQ